MTASQSESGFDIDEERRRELLNRIRYMASSGLYADHTAINAQLSLNIDYPFVSECFADEVFNTHIDEMCSRVRKEHSANSPSEAGLNTRSDGPVQVVPVRVVGEGEETWTAKAMDEGPEEERQQERKAEIAKQIAKASTGSPRSPATTGLSSVANMLDMASFLARTERKAEAKPPEHDTTERVYEHEAAEKAADAPWLF